MAPESNKANKPHSQRGQPHSDHVCHKEAPTTLDFERKCSSCKKVASFLLKKKKENSQFKMLAWYRKKRVCIPMLFCFFQRETIVNDWFILHLCPLSRQYWRRVSFLPKEHNDENYFILNRDFSTWLPCNRILTVPSPWKMISSSLRTGRQKKAQSFWASL